MKATIILLLCVGAFIAGAHVFATHYPEYVNSKEDIEACANAHQRQSKYELREDDLGQDIAKMNDLALEMCKDIGL